MVDPTRQRGETGRPMGPEPDKEQEVDPEKFKKVLKVEASSEAEKRQQRRLKKGEEEGDEDEDVEEKASVPQPSSSFAEFMEDKNELDDLFDAESSGVRKQAAPKTSMMAPEPGSISTEGVELEEEPTAGAQPQAQAQPQTQPSPYEPQQQTPQATQQQQPQEEGFPNYQEGMYSQPPTYPTNESQTNQNQDQDQNQPDYSQDQVQQTTPQEQAEQHDKEPSKQKEEDASLLASQPEKDALKSKKKPPSKPAPRVETMTPEEEKIGGPTPLKTEDAPVGKQPTEGPKKEEVFPHAGEESIMPTFTGAPSPPSGEEKGKEATEKPLEAPIQGEAKPPPEMKEMPIPKEEEPEEQTAGVGASKRGKAKLPPEMEHDVPSRPKTEKQMVFERFTPEQIRDQKMGKPSALQGRAGQVEDFAAPALPEEDMGMMGEGRKDKKDDFPFINSEQLTAALPTSDAPLPPVTPSAETPAYSKLSPETYELFEKMVGTIIIQDHSGVTSTTVTLNMPNSIFNGAQVTFDRYQTAPNSYNLQLSGSPQAIEAFTSNMADLVAAFKQGQHAFEVNILRPALVEKKPLIRRKGAAGDGGGRNKK